MANERIVEEIRRIIAAAWESASDRDPHEEAAEQIDALVTAALAQAEREREKWQEEARRYAQHSDYWRVEVEWLKWINETSLAEQRRVAGDLAESNGELRADLARVRAAVRPVPSVAQGSMCDSLSVAEVIGR